MAIDSYLIVRRPGSGIPAFATETTDATFSKYNSMLLSSFSLATRNTSTITGTGTGAGKATFDTLTVTKTNSLNSPLFVQALTNGIIIPRLTLVLRPTVGTGTPQYSSVYSFGTALVTEVADNASAGDGAPTQTITFAFGQFAYHYYTYSPTGAKLNEYTTSWNIMTNVAWSGYTPLDGPVTA